MIGLRRDSREIYTELHQVILGPYTPNALLALSQSPGEYFATQ
jgi:hypothetical protein